MLAFCFIPSFTGLITGVVQLPAQVVGGFFRLLGSLFRFFRGFVSGAPGLARGLVCLTLPFFGRSGASSHQCDHDSTRERSSKFHDSP